MNTAPEVSSLALPAGSRLEHYEIQGTLGSGAFGVTYQAYSHRFHSPCVIKELLPVDYAYRAPTQRIEPISSDLMNILAKCQHDFMREATILHSVDHPHVVKILDYFDGNGTSYFVMPFAEGVNLEAFIRRRGINGAMEEGELLEFMYAVLDGLECVHSKNFLHRDLKPENIIITSTGQPLLIDFGAARQLIGSRSRPMSAILTRCYAPFEQYSTTQKQGPYTDIYALGAIMQRVITGSPPHEAPDRIDAGASLPSLESIMAGGRYSSRLLRAIDWALRPQARLRPQSIAEWRVTLPARPSSAPLPSIAEAAASRDSQPPPLPTSQQPPCLPPQGNIPHFSSRLEGTPTKIKPKPRMKIAALLVGAVLILAAFCYLILSVLVR